VVPMKKLLILSPYDGFSHGFWREGLADYLAGEFEITQCTSRGDLPAIALGSDDQSNGFQPDLGTFYG